MAGAKGPLDSIKAGIGSLASRLPFIKGKSVPTPEPFSSIEDDTPLGDLLSSRNAAPVSPKTKAKIERPDFRRLFETLLKRTPVLIGIIATIGLVIVVIIVSVATSLPPKTGKAAAAFTKEGEALVKQWLPPPGDPLEARVRMERSGVPSYSAADAAKIARPNDPGIAAGLAEKNDEAMEDLYGTVP